MTDEEKIEQAAEEYLREHMDNGDLMPVIPTYDMDVFKFAIQWRVENPSPAVLELLTSMIVEAKQHLRMYVKAYKHEPYDTWKMLEIYVRESVLRISRAEQALAAWKNVHED